MRKHTIEFSKHAMKTLQKIPHHIQDELSYWINCVMSLGIEETRKISGLHDEPLHGNLRDFRSVRLNSSYRAFYTHIEDSIKIEEINKHEY